MVSHVARPISTAFLPDPRVVDEKCFMSAGHAQGILPSFAIPLLGSRAAIIQTRISVDYFKKPSISI